MGSISTADVGPIPLLRQLSLRVLQISLKDTKFGRGMGRNRIPQEILQLYLYEAPRRRPIKLIYIYIYLYTHVFLPSDTRCQLLTLITVTFYLYRCQYRLIISRFFYMFHGFLSFFSCIRNSDIRSMTSSAYPAQAAGDVKSGMIHV